MKKTVSLKLNREFHFLYRRGKSAVNPILAMYARKTKNASNRLGITVSTKVGKAIVRIRVRRRIREAYRINEDRFLPGFDIIVVARVRAGVSSFYEIEESLLELSGKLRLISEEQE